ncbi:MAG: amino acid decarboxylase [Candidatus Improbicoccus devescovinae]|nr:MAG: amino acid decarboxylase [Candidatus Improbicoccus devescovinae]
MHKKIDSYLKLNRSLFCVPGHKGIINKYDLTELPETDDLYDPKEYISSLESRISRLYNSNISVISTGGNTLCIQTMLRIFFQTSGELIVLRNVHKSVVNTMILLGIHPIWIAFSYNIINILSSINHAIDTNPNAKAIFLTSVDYYGNILDIKNICNIVHKKNKNILILVDNSHGSHLKFTRNSNLHPLDCGADACADSAHKTLPVLTGGAWLHVNKKIEIKEIKTSMGLFGSTSPSFLIINSIQNCINWLEINCKLKFNIFFNMVKYIKKCAENSKILCNFCNDPGRIVLDFCNYKTTDQEILKYFNKYKIEPEFVLNKKVVLIPSPFNKYKDWLRLECAVLLKKIRFNFVYCEKYTKENHDIYLDLPKVILNLREAMFLESESVVTENSAGRICAEVACKCPPGTIIVAPGELIGENEQKNLLNNKIIGIKVIKKNISGY